MPANFPRRNVSVLDCTLRDGGRIIDCAFPDEEIKGISDGLADAKVDIIEVGFLRDAANVSYRGGSTFFTDVDQIRPFVDKSRKNVKFVAFIDFGMFDFKTLKPCDGRSIDGIRFGFTKKNYRENRQEVVRCIREIKSKGYLAFVQGVNSLNYSDKEILELVEMINDVHPYSFGIVDTYGAMYIEDVDRIYGLIDHNMDPDICINFHSHNNYQLSFGFAQEVIKLSRGVRRVIIDGTIGGMGKVAGNLNTELLVNYLNRKLHYGYELDVLLDLFDNFIYKYSQTHEWGYSIPAMMAGVYKSHPNNVIYLMNKFRLDTKDIGNILSLIEPDKRQRYDYDNIERLYAEYSSKKADDAPTVAEFRRLVANREVLILAPGRSLDIYREQIDLYASEHNAICFSVNFVADNQECVAFFGNQKRFNLLRKKCVGRKLLLCSNVENCEGLDAGVVDYQSVICRGHRFADNSTIMLLNFLKRAGAESIAIAGMDGFDASREENYADPSFQNDRHAHEFDELNADIACMLEEISEELAGRCALSTITPGEFGDVIRYNEEALAKVEQ